MKSFLISVSYTHSYKEERLPCASACTRSFKKKGLQRSDLIKYPSTQMEGQLSHQGLFISLPCIHNYLTTLNATAVVIKNEKK